MFNTTISIYASHDANVCFKAPDGQYRIYELERLTKQRYYSLDTDTPRGRYDTLVKMMYEINRDYSDVYFDKCLYGHPILPDTRGIVSLALELDNFHDVGHHLSHAAGAFRLSGYDSAVILSYDGGGFDSDTEAYTFRIFLADKISNTYKPLFNNTIDRQLDFGRPYMTIPVAMSEIRKGNSLSYAGKVMGLAGYGSVVQDWVPYVTQYYREGSLWSDEHMQHLCWLGDRIGLDLSENAQMGQPAYDLAATSQYVFQMLVIEILVMTLKKAQISNTPLCVTGGCALNVLLNQKLREMGFEVFVPPNPNDCGLAFGQLMLLEPPQDTPVVTYTGVGLLGNMPVGQSYTPADLARLIYDGKIIGVARGRSECGPRALGNRSILCDPARENMKDILNNKVKHREWFRPFAPVVKEDRANEFFEMGHGNSPFMSFAQKVRPEWQKLKAITHIDGTARVQTVSKEQNDFLYALLDEFEKLSGYPVLLNTSLNIKGAPIVTYIEDVIKILHETEIDYVVIEDVLIGK